MAQTLTRLLVHIIFSTKERQNLIPAAVEAELYAYLGGICRGADSPLLQVGGTANHLHLLVSLSKNLALSALLLDLKRDSSKWIKSKGAPLADFHWQDGYGAFSVGESQVAAVTAYIQRQKERHQTMTFEQEFVEFLRKYKVPYDPQYVWTWQAMGGSDDPFRVGMRATASSPWALPTATIAQPFRLEAPCLTGW